MTVLTRIRRIVRTNLDDLLAEARAPETTVDGLIRDLHEAVLEMRQSTAAATASCSATQRRIQRVEEDVARQHAQAESAVRDEDEARARSALRREAQDSGRLKALRIQLHEEQQQADRLKNELAQAEGKLQEIRTRRDALVSGQGRIAARQRLAHVSVDDGLRARTTSGLADLERLEDDAEDQLAEVEARESLSDRARAGVHLEEDTGEESGDRERAVGANA